MKIDIVKLVTLARLEKAAEDWFGDLDPKAQLAYLKAHPASKMNPSNKSEPNYVNPTDMREAVGKHAHHHAFKAALWERKSGDFRERGQHGTAAVYQEGEIKHRKASDHYKDAHRAYSTGDVKKGHEHARKGAAAANDAYKYEEDKRLT